MAGLSARGPLPFAKMSGSGNDFILMNDIHEGGRGGRLAGLDLAELARRVCSRHTGVGADGLIVIEPAAAAEADFGWRFFNADGSQAGMCGNGGRCAARYAFQEGIAPAAMTFETGAGLIAAEVKGSRVRIQLTRPKDYRPDIVLDVEGKAYSVDFVDTGVPHAVVFVEDPGEAPVERVGRAIRRHPRFAPAGTNVNFAAVRDRGHLRVRTYERGVEAETLACGTGSVASVLTAWKRDLAGTEAEVETRGGERLRVIISPEPGQEYPRVFLEGETIFICRGVIEPEAYAP